MLNPALTTLLVVLTETVLWGQDLKTNDEDPSYTRVQIQVELVFGIPGQDQGPGDKREGTELRDVTLLDLTSVVQRVTKKTFVWSEEMALQNRRVHFVSDKPVLNDPDLLWKAYQSILEVSGLTVCPQGHDVYTIVSRMKVKKNTNEGSGFKVRLQGTMPCTSNPKRGVAFIRSTVGNIDLVAFIDEPITHDGKLYEEFAGWKLVEVSKDKAIFSDGNQRLELSLERPK